MTMIPQGSIAALMAVDQSGNMCQVKSLTVSTGDYGATVEVNGQALQAAAYPQLVEIASSGRGAAMRFVQSVYIDPQPGLEGVQFNVLPDQPAGYGNYMMRGLMYSVPFMNPTEYADRLSPPTPPSGHESPFKGLTGYIADQICGDRADTGVSSAQVEHNAADGVPVRYELCSQTTWRAAGAGRDSFDAAFDAVTAGAKSDDRYAESGFCVVQDFQVIGFSGDVRDNGALTFCAIGAEPVPTRTTGDPQTICYPDGELCTTRRSDAVVSGKIVARFEMVGGRWKRTD